MSAYTAVWFVDFEFHAPPGERPEPLCMVAHELYTQQEYRLWQDDLYTLDAAPYPAGKDVLFVAYYASAELGCHLALNWPMPANILDLYVEFRNLTNGRETPCGDGLLGACTYFGIDSMQPAAKEGYRDLAIRGGPFTNWERSTLLDYCASDVYALAGLYEAMYTRLDIPRALVRGQFMVSARLDLPGVCLGDPYAGAD